MRALPEWIAKHDDAPIPSRVQLRLWERSGGSCQSCGRKIMTGETKHFDHKVPLADGGEHREANLQVLCVACHKAKTVTENRERARVRRKAKAALGLVEKAPKLQGRPFDTTRKAHNRRKKAQEKLPVPPPRPLYGEASNG